MSDQTDLVAHYVEDRPERSLLGLHEFLLQKTASIFDPNKPLLDVGCGTGAWLRRLEEVGFLDLTGLDLDGGSFLPTKAKKHLADLNLNNWSDALPSRRFDQITCIEVIEHIENSGYFLSQLSSLLSRNGKLIVTTPNIHSLSARLKFGLQGKLKLMDEAGDPTHITPIYLVGFRRLLSRYGLTIVGIETYPKRGSVVDLRLLSIIRRCAALFLRDPLPGDIMIMTIQHSSTA